MLRDFSRRDLFFAYDSRKKTTAFQKIRQAPSLLTNLHNVDTKHCFQKSFAKMGEFEKFYGDSKLDLYVDGINNSFIIKATILTP